MTEKITIIKYKCKFCKELFENEQDAAECEKKPVTQDKGAKVGDKVVILSGDGAGNRATVESIRVIDKYWGHYRWERYWHTIQVVAKIDDGPGSRVLTYDCYEVVDSNDMVDALGYARSKKQRK